MAGIPCRLRMLLLLLLAAPPVCPFTFSSNGYEDLVVAVADKVPEDMKIIDEIKAIFTSASSYLYTATKRRAYLRSVKILVPRNWTRQADWASRQDESVATAQVRVDEASALYGDTPYTFQPGQCGEPGQYIHLTPAFLTNVTFRNTFYGDGGRLLVHEFAHLRYGVFDEYGFGDNMYPFFYLDDRNQVKPTGCAAGITGSYMDRRNRLHCVTDPDTSLPDENCFFQPDVTGNTVRASIMFQQAVASIEHFCENTIDPGLRHDRNAPNQQNRMCKGRATYSVIADHEDFKNGNPPVTVGDTTPTFTVVQDKSSTTCGSRGVLVMDVSGSMTTNNRMLRQSQTAATIIDALPQSSRLGLVTFSTTATKVRDFQTINGDSDRSLLKGSLPTLATGYTAIGLGLQKAVEMLKADGGTTPEDHVFLTTDGEENLDPKVATILAELVQTGVHFHTLGYSSSASMVLSNISKETGGQFFYFEENVDSTILSALASAISNLMNRCEDEVKVELDRAAFPALGTGVLQERALLVDNSVGRNMVFTFVLSQALAVKVQVFDPSGKVYNSNSTEYKLDSTLNIITIAIPHAEAGQWKYEVHNTGAVAGLVVSNVQAQPMVGGVPVDVTSWMGNDIPGASIIYAHVHKGYNPVLCADVNASVSRPNDSPAIIPLYDNGRMPDNRAGDGVYSGVFGDFAGSGRHSVDVSVRSTSCTVLLTAGPTSTGAMPLVPVPPPSVTAIPLSNLTRLQTGPTIQQTSSATSAGRPAPPSTVNDLRVTSVDRDRRHVTLSWTAPGGDGLFGMVESTDLRMGSSYDHLEFNFTDAVFVNGSLILNGSLVPIPAGQPHHLTVNLSGPSHWGRSTYVFGLQAFDDQGLTSDLSNMVVVTFDPVTYAQNTGPPVVMGGEKATETTPIEVVDKKDNETIVIKPEEWSNMGAVVGGVVGGLAGFAILISIIVLLVAKIQAKKHQGSHEVSPFEDVRRVDSARAKFGAGFSSGLEPSLPQRVELPEHFHVA